MAKSKPKTKVKVLRKLSPAKILRQGKFVKAQLRVVQKGKYEERQYKTPGQPWRHTRPGMSFY